MLAAPRVNSQHLNKLKSGSSKRKVSRYILQNAEAKTTFENSCSHRFSIV
jgi:hypothetical protein